jgi:hypothetical protein
VIFSFLDAPLRTAENVVMVRAVRSLRVAFVLLALSFGVACKKQEPPALDPGLERALDLVAERCSVEVDSGLVQCPRIELGEVASGLVVNGRPNLVKLHTLAVALSSTDPKRRVVAASLIRNVYATSFGPSAPSRVVHPATAEALIEATGKLPAVLAQRVAPAAAHAAMLTKKGESLDAALRSQTPGVKREAYRALMTHGRLGAFLQLRDVARGDTEDILAALASVSSMQDWTAEERAELCPWLESFTGHAQRAVADEARAALKSCEGQQKPAAR